MFEKERVYKYYIYIYIYSTIRKRKKKTPQKAHTRESEKKVKRETRIQKHYIKNI
jgi:predicted membrane protein